MKLNVLSRLIPIAVISFGLAAFSGAQAAGPTGGQLKANPRAQGRRAPVLQALSKLDLSKDQKAKIRELVKTRAENVKAFRAAHKGDKDAMRTFARDQQKVFMDGIKGVLTAPQWDQFQIELKKINEEARAARRNKGNPTNPGTPPANGASKG